MSPLPQRKKTPEEIQQLRGHLGVPVPPESRTPPAPSTKPEAAPTAPPAAASQPDVAEDPAPSIPFATPAKPFRRSLKRSDWEPGPQSPTANPAASATLPSRRHSRSELEEMRRREALSNFSTGPTPSVFPQPASPFTIAAGYLFASASWSWLYWRLLPLELVGGFAALALSCALWILVFRSISRHHSGFIGVITLLALVFAALHYFPQLRYAS